MFSNGSRNRKRKPTNLDAPAFWESIEPQKPTEEEEPCPKQAAHHLNAQIGVLENFLQKHHEAELNRLEMKAQNIIPPPEHLEAKRARVHAFTMAEKRKYLSQRNRHGLQFLLLFSLAFLIGWWILYVPI